MHQPRDNCLLPLGKHNETWGVNSKKKKWGALQPTYLRGISCPLGPWGQAITAPTMFSVESFKACWPIVVRRQSSDNHVHNFWIPNIMIDFLQNLDQFPEILYKYSITRFSSLHLWDFKINLKLDCSQNFGSIFKTNWNCGYIQANVRNYSQHWTSS